MFLTVGGQPSLWKSLLPEEVLRLPEKLARVDVLLDDPAFFAPFARHFDGSAVRACRENGESLCHGHPQGTSAASVRSTRSGSGSRPPRDRSRRRRPQWSDRSMVSTATTSAAAPSSDLQWTISSKNPWQIPRSLPIATMRSAAAGHRQGLPTRVQLAPAGTDRSAVTADNCGCIGKGLGRQRQRDTVEKNERPCVDNEALAITLSTGGFAMSTKRRADRDQLVLECPRSGCRGRPRSECAPPKRLEDRSPSRTRSLGVRRTWSGVHGRTRLLAAAQNATRTDISHLGALHRVSANAQEMPARPTERTRRSPGRVQHATGP
jgi:hypothetical protein